MALFFTQDLGELGDQGRRGGLGLDPARRCSGSRAVTLWSVAGCLRTPLPDGRGAGDGGRGLGRQLEDVLPVVGNLQSGELELFQDVRLDDPAALAERSAVVARLLVVRDLLDLGQDLGPWDFVVGPAPFAIGSVLETKDQSMNTEIKHTLHSLDHLTWGSLTAP